VKESRPSVPSAVSQWVDETFHILTTITTGKTSYPAAFKGSRQYSEEHPDEALSPEKMTRPGIAGHRRPNKV
jgi:hypothetical protein